MMLWSTIALFVHAVKGGDGPGGGVPDQGSVHQSFPTGPLTSSAWEGWWHDDAAAPVYDVNPQ